MGRSFKDWWATVPEDLRTKAKGNDDWDTYKPILNELNFVIVMLNHSGKSDMCPCGFRTIQGLFKVSHDILNLHTRPQVKISDRMST